MENKINMLEAARLYLPFRNNTGIDVGDIKRLLATSNDTDSNIKINAMFETGTGLAGASSVYDMPRKTYAKRSNMNYCYYPDLSSDYDWGIIGAQSVMYNRYLAIHRASVVIRLLLFVVLILLIVKIAKK